MEIYIAVMGIGSYEGFWKMSPRAIMSLAEIKLGKSPNQAARKMLEDWGEGED